jgi:aryl-alcohol dehydrogenase-like predicted oxidoreductase
VETAETLLKLKQAGKIRHIGLTNFNTRQLKGIVEAGIPVLTNQLQYSPIDRRPEKELVPFCQQKQIMQLCYGSLAGGFFSDYWFKADEPGGPLSNRSLTKYKLIIEDIGGWGQFQQILAGMSQIAKKHHVNLSQVALKWTLDQSQVAAVIVGATSTKHLKENLGVFDFSFDPDDLQGLEEILKQSLPLSGDCFDLERDKKGRHGSIMRYNENRN